MAIRRLGKRARTIRAAIRVRGTRRRDDVLTLLSFPRKRESRIWVPPLRGRPLRGRLTTRRRLPRTRLGPSHWRARRSARSALPRQPSFAADPPPAADRAGYHPVWPRRILAKAGPTKQSLRRLVSSTSGSEDASRPGIGDCFACARNDPERRAECPRPGERSAPAERPIQLFPPIPHHVDRRCRRHL